MIERVPTCEKDGDQWIIKVERGAPVRVKDGWLAYQILRLAAWSYHNGRDDALGEVRDAIGVSP